MFGRTSFLLWTTLLSGAAHAILTAWALRSFEAVRRRRGWAIGVALVLTLLVPATRWMAMRVRSEAVTLVYAGAMIEMLVVAMSAVPITLVRSLGGLVRWRKRSRKRRGQQPVPEHAKGEVGRREVLERAVGLAAIGTSAAAFGWGMVRGRHAFTVEEVVVPIPGLPRALEGYTFAQVSDMHAGLFVGHRELVEGLSRVREINADMLVVTGDLVDFDARYGPELGRALADAGARARDGVVAILGNHDYYAGAGAVAASMRAAGIDVLVNAGKTVRPGDGGGFALLGVDDLWARRRGGTGPSLDKAIAMVPRDLPRILLAHNPTYLDASAGKVALQLSGHMHGGQINPGIHVAALFARYVAGRYARDGTTLWVNRGFGVAGPPVRLDAAPEVTKVVLVGA
jgi:predicted MPP superfamily phosphohydrolase